MDWKKLLEDLEEEQLLASEAEVDPLIYESLELVLDVVKHHNALLRRLSDQTEILVEEAPKVQIGDTAQCAYCPDEFVAKKVGQQYCSEFCEEGAATPFKGLSLVSALERPVDLREPRKLGWGPPNKQRRRN